MPTLETKKKTCFSTEAKSYHVYQKAISVSLSVSHQHWQRIWAAGCDWSPRLQSPGRGPECRPTSGSTAWGRNGSTPWLEAKLDAVTPAVIQNKHRHSAGIRLVLSIWGTLSFSYSIQHHWKLSIKQGIENNNKQVSGKMHFQCAVNISLKCLSVKKLIRSNQYLQKTTAVGFEIWKLF